MMHKLSLKILLIVFGLTACKSTGGSEFKYIYQIKGDDPVGKVDAWEYLDADGKVTKWETDHIGIHEGLRIEESYTYDDHGNRTYIVRYEESMAEDKPQGPLNALGIPKGEMVRISYRYYYDEHDEWYKFEIFDHQDQLFIYKTRKLEYDEQGHLISELTVQEKMAEGWHNPPLLITYTYDQRGNRLTSTSHDESGQPTSILKMEYDHQNQLIGQRFYYGEEEFPGGREEYDYDTKGNKVVARQYYCGEQDCDQLYKTIDYEYDPSGRLIREWHRPADGSLAEGFRFEYKKQ